MKEHGMKHIYIVRHGQTVWNVKNIICGIWCENCVVWRYDFEEG